MITRLTIQHYRSIENIDLTLGPVGLLVGRNGAGKSNIIDAIKFVRDAMRHGLDKAISDRNGISSIRQWSPTRPYDISIGLEVETNLGKGGFAFTLSSAGDEFSIKRESGHWNVTNAPPITTFSPDEMRSPTEWSYSRAQDGAITTRNNYGDEGYRAQDSQEFTVSTLKMLFFGHLRDSVTDFEAYSIFSNTLREPQKLANDPHLTSHGVNLASVLKRMRAKKRSEAVGEIVSAMQAVIPDLDTVTVQSVGGFVVPQFRVKDAATGKTHVFNVSQVSDGSLRILGLLTALYQDPAPATIALEEPEQTIHPGALKVLSDSIKEASSRTQVLVTTHSPDLLDSFDPSQIVAVEHDGSSTKASPLAAAQVEAVRNNLFSLGQLMSIEGLHG